MASDIGVRIGIDGEREFRTALNGVNAQIRNLSSEMRAAVTSLSGMADEEETAARRTDILNRSIQATQQKIELITGEYNRARQRLDELGQALEDAKREFGENSQEALRAENAYNRQVATVNRLGTQLNDATAELNRMQSELRQTENALEDMGDEANTAGSRVSEGFTVMKGAIAGVVGDILSSAVDAFRNLVGEALNAADSLTKFGSTMEFAGFDTKTIDESRKAVQEYAARTVYDLETVSNTTAQLAANGVKDFVGLTEAAGNLNAVAGGNAETFGSLAMALTQTIGAGKLTTENWNQIADAIPGASGKLQEALRENGAFVGDFREAMAAGEITAEEFSEAIMNLGMTDAAKEAASSVATIEGAVGNLQATIVDGITGLLTGGGMESITGFINGITSVLETAGTYISPAIEMIKTSLSGIGEAFRSAFTPEQQGAIVGFLENLAGALIAVPFGLVATAVEILSTALQFLIEVGGAVADFFSGLPDGIITAGNAFDDFKEAVAKSVTEALDKVTQWGEDLLTTVSEAASGAVESVSTFFSELPGNVETFVSDALNKVVEWGGDIISEAAEAGEGFLTKIGDFLSDLPENVAEWISGAVTAVITWGKEMKAQAEAKMEEVKTGIKMKLESLPSEILKIGENIITGLWKGIQNKLSWVKSKVQSAVDGIKNIFSSVTGFNTHSPSVWAEQIGEWVMEGLARGMTKGGAIAYAAAKATADNTKTTLSRALLGMASELNNRLIAKEEELVRRLEDTGLDDVTKKTLQANLEAVKKFRSEYVSALDDLEKKQASLADKLKSYGDLFTTVETDVGEFLELGDLQKDIGAINAYSNALEALKARGASDSLMNEILALDVESGTKVAEMLLEKTDEEFDHYMDLWGQKQKAAADIAAKFYADQRAVLVTDFIEKIPADFDVLSEDLYGMGIAIIGELAEGMKANQDAVALAGQAIGGLANTSLMAEIEAINTFRNEMGAYLEELEKGMDDIEKRQTAMTDKLIASYGKLFDVVKEDSEEVFLLSDPAKLLADMNRYDDALTALISRGAPEFLLTTILDMDVEDATTTMEEILKKTDEGFDEYIKNWQALEEKSTDIATRTFANQRQALNDQYLSKIKEDLAVMEDDAYYLGAQIPEGLAAGIMSGMHAVEAAAKALGDTARAALQTSEGIHSPARKWIPLGDYMAQGVGEGFTRRMKSVAANITASIPTPTAYADHMAQVGSGVVNGIQSAVAGMRTGSTYTFNLMLPDGSTLARYQLPALIDVARANGTPILNPM